MRLWRAQILFATACATLLAASAFAQQSALTLEHISEQSDDPRGTANPTEADHALALYRADEWNRALVCPEQRAATQPTDHHRIRCEYPRVATLATGPVALTVGLSSTHHEHEGMYGSTEDIVVLSRNPLASDQVVIATLTQLDVDVVDTVTHFRMRRQRVVDLDHDGENDLCIESVEEEGPGLFEVMDLHGRPFRPTRRTRGIDAWSVDPAGALQRREALDENCPSRGYTAFVTPAAVSDDPVERRRTVQGAARR